MRYMRLGLLLLAGGQLLPGIWALAAPSHFHATFPGAGTPWVAADGPFNHHLIVDAGAGLAATGAALLLAAAWSSRQARAVALAAYLVHALPHLAYHAGHAPGALGAAEQALTWVPLAGGVVLAVGLLASTLRWQAVTSHAAVPRADQQTSARIREVGGKPRSLLLRVGFAVARRRLGVVPAAWRVIARVPRLVLARMVADAAHERTRHLPAHLAALATLRAATLVECPFCIDILSATATTEGVSSEQLRELPRWRQSTAFDSDERVVLGLADATTSTPAVVDDELVEALVDRFGEEALVELAAVLGHENARARANRVLDIAPQGFADASCPLPGSAAP